MMRKLIIVSFSYMMLTKCNIHKKTNKKITIMSDDYINITFSASP